MTSHCMIDCLNTLWLFSHDGKVRILNFNSRCASWIKIRKTVFWTMCTPNHVEIRDLRCASQITVQRCFRVTHLTNHATKSLYECHDLWIVFWGAELVWPSNLFRLYTTRCICTEAQEMRAPCMFDWQGTQTFFSRWNANSKFGRLCVHCIIQNSPLLWSCVHCVIQTAHFELKFKIRTLLLCENNSLCCRIVSVLFVFNRLKVDIVLTPCGKPYICMEDKTCF